MNVNLLRQLEKQLVGRQCEIIRREADWAANLVGGGSISLSVPWRIVANGRIAFANEHDGQRFGLPAPVDGEVEANRLIRGRPISKVLVAPDTADLTLFFGDGVRLDAFSHSAGYEGWHIVLPKENGGIEIIALGGGEVVTF